MLQCTSMLVSIYSFRATGLGKLINDAQDMPDG